MDRLHISRTLSIPLNEITLSAIRSQGAGGQNVNKVATGIHLRFDIKASSLPDEIKLRLLQIEGQHLTKGGVIIIKSQQTRSQEQNRINALTMLADLIKAVLSKQKPRKKTKPSRSSKEKRLESKYQRGRLKELRRKIPPQ